jgi:hypothetical protein
LWYVSIVIMVAAVRGSSAERRMLRKAAHSQIVNFDLKYHAMSYFAAENRAVPLKPREQPRGGAAQRELSGSAGPLTTPLPQATKFRQNLMA